MSLRDIEASLPPGFRFFPSDEELVCHYLYNKISGEKVSDGFMVEVNLHVCEPWQLPDVAKLSDNDWYFFSFRDRKYATGFRSNRTTTAGFWKATGKDRPIYNSTTHAMVGMRKTLVFYLGRAPNGIKSGWIMHEFRLECMNLPPKEEWVLCRVFHRGKGELVTRNCLENEYDYQIGTYSPNLSSSPPVDTLMPPHSFPQCSYHQGNNPSTSRHTQPLNPTFLELSHRDCYAPINQTSCSRSGDDFLFDMILENDVGATGCSSIGEMGFEDNGNTSFP